jgi:hypothetical protein
MDKMTNLVGQPIKRIGEFQGKTKNKKVAAARLEPWPIIFCSIPHLFESGGEKAMDSAPSGTRMQVGIKCIRYPGRKSRIAFSRAICNFFIRNEILIILIISLATDQKHKAPFNIRSI